MDLLRDHETPFDRDFYNGMEDVEAANSRVQERRAAFDSFLGDARNLAARHDVDGSIGALLLHKHWNSEPAELMIEVRTSTAEGSPSLTTRSRSVRTWRRRRMWPCRWSIMRHDKRASLLPLEYSSDIGVGQVHACALITNAFLDGYLRLLCRYGFSDTIGLAIARRKALSRKAGEEFVEENYDSQSVISAQVVSPEDRAKLIETVWPIGKPATFGCRPGCKQYCGPRCDPSCMKYCRSYCSHGGAHTCRHHMSGHNAGHGSGHGTAHGSEHEYTPVCRPHGCG